MDINVTIKVFKTRTVMAHAAWMHHLAHMIFAITNLVVLSWAAYHMVRFDGFGFYDYSDNGEGTIDMNKLFDQTLVNVQGSLIPAWGDEGMKSVCPEKQHTYYANWVTDGFAHRLWLSLIHI